MNKIFSTIKDLFPLLMLAIVLVLIFVPLPVMLIQILIILNLAFSLCLFASKFFSKPAIVFHLPRLVQYFCLFTFALIIATTRTFLAISSLEEQIPLILIIGQWICRENCICGIFTTLMLCASLLLFCKKYLIRAQDAARIFFRLCLDTNTMNQKIFAIEQQVAEKKITKEESEILKEKVWLKANLYGSMDGAAKFLLGTMGVFSVLYIIAVIGGVAVGILVRNMQWKDALDEYVMLSSGYLVLFVVPLFLASLGFRTGKPEQEDEETFMAR